MKRISTFILSLVISAAAVAQSTTTFQGNGGSGFGGAIGGSTLSITEDVTSLTFNVKRGAGDFSDALVLYLDLIPGGETSNTNYVDMFDNPRSAISGLSSGGKSTINFPPNFAADFAIVVSPTNTSAGLYTLSNIGNFTYVQPAGLTPFNVSSASFSFSILKVSLGFGPRELAKFNFFGTYLNGRVNSTYRSNEGYGTFNFGNITDANGNPAYNTVNVLTYLIYPAVVLPVNLLSFSGSVADSKGRLNWQVANDDEVRQYELQKSTDGKEYKTVQIITAKHTTALQNYTIEDTRLAATNLYRLRTTDDKGFVFYSKTVQLSTGLKGQGFTIFPNPVLQTLNLKMAKPEAGRYDVNVYNATGQMVFGKTVQYDGSGNTLQITLPANLQKGSYNCILSSDAGRFSSAFLKQ